MFRRIALHSVRLATAVATAAAAALVAAAAAVAKPSIPHVELMSDTLPASGWVLLALVALAVGFAVAVIVDRRGVASAPSGSGTLASVRKPTGRSSRGGDSLKRAA